MKPESLSHLPKITQLERSRLDEVVTPFLTSPFYAEASFYRVDAEAAKGPGITKFLVFSGGRRYKDASWVLSYKGTNPIHKRSTLMI